MLGKLVVSKDQKAGRIKWSDIEVQIHTITSKKKIMDKLAVLEIVLFDELSNKQRATGEVADIFK